LFPLSFSISFEFICILWVYLIPVDLHFYFDFILDSWIYNILVFFEVLIKRYMGQGRREVWYTQSARKQLGLENQCLTTTNTDICRGEHIEITV